MVASSSSRRWAMSSSGDVRTCPTATMCSARPGSPSTTPRPQRVRPGSTPSTRTDHSSRDEHLFGTVVAVHDVTVATRRGRRRQAPSYRGGQQTGDAYVDRGWTGVLGRPDLSDHRLHQSPPPHPFGVQVRPVGPQLQTTLDECRHVDSGAVEYVRDRVVQHRRRLRGGVPDVAVRVDYDPVVTMAEHVVVMQIPMEDNGFPGALEQAPQGFAGDADEVTADRVVVRKPQLVPVEVRQPDVETRQSGGVRRVSGYADRPGGRDDRPGAHVVVHDVRVERRTRSDAFQEERAAVGVVREQAYRSPAVPRPQRCRLAVDVMAGRPDL